MRHWAGAPLTTGEQRPGSPGADMEPEQLGQFAPDRHFPPFVAFAVTDGDDALGQADVLDPELYQLGGAGAGFQQGLQHQPDAPALRVGLVEEAQFLLDCQPFHAAAMFRGSMQASTLPGSPEHGLALGVIDAFTDENGGDCFRGARNGDQGSACSFSDGVQTKASQSLVWH